jgi:hypothetical protein
LNVSLQEILGGGVAVSSFVSDIALAEVASLGKVGRSSITATGASTAGRAEQVAQCVSDLAGEWAGG